ncbi:MAG: hypothetical protein IJF15_04955, partial [Oscillospiraceae bacterium]|nr:hypothetical protein [Oscillospiraceae bacterium]
VSENKGVIFADEDFIMKYREQYVIGQEITDALSEDRVEVFLQPKSRWMRASIGSSLHLPPKKRYTQNQRFPLKKR